VPFTGRRSSSLLSDTVLSSMPLRLLSSTLALLLTSCGGGVITSRDVSPGEAVVIGLIVIVATLYVVYVGGRGR
jgi:putative effector of murein hydrolase LrgA (UPF0299 family)